MQEHITTRLYKELGYVKRPLPVLDEVGTRELVYGVVHADSMDYDVAMLTNRLASVMGLPRQVIDSNVEDSPVKLYSLCAVINAYMGYAGGEFR